MRPRACRAPRCDTGYADRDGDLGNGCEVSTQDDTHHCGACGAKVAPRALTAGATCVGGRCGSRARRAPATATA
ncbi:MAG: hypothetical protein U0325_34755 [Polyangiales bacterium]